MKKRIAPAKPSARRVHRKRRTREHVIADLSVNHLERFALRCGCSVERPRSDYGLDLTLFTYNQRGEIENGVVYFQVKATDKIRLVHCGSRLACRIQRKDISYWLAEKQPVILVVYDAARDRAFWLYVQAHFEQMAGFRLSATKKSITVQLSTANLLNVNAIRRFIQYRNAVEAQQRGQVKHHA